MKKYPRESKNVDVNTVAQNVSGAMAKQGKVQHNDVQMGGEARMKARAKTEAIQGLDDAMRAENVRRKNPFVKAQLEAMDKMSAKGEENKIRNMFPKASRKGK